MKTNDLDLKTIAATRGPPIPAKEFPSGLDRLFDRPARLRTRRGLANTEIRRVGRIEAPSGFFACDDPGLWNDGAAVFDMTIPAGKHAIDLLTDDKMRIVGAARVVFAKRPK